MKNHAPGDVALVIDGQTYILRLTFAAALAIEDDTNRGLVDLTLKTLPSGRIGPLVHTARRLLEAGGTALDYEACGTLVIHHVADVLRAVLECLAWGLTGEKPEPVSLNADNPPTENAHAGAASTGETPAKKRTGPPS